MAQSASTQGRPQHYAVPQPMPWPIIGSTALFLMAIGGVFVMNGSRVGWVPIGAGFILLLYMMVSWFIFSEVMFFGAFFGALFWARLYSVPDLGSIESNALMWPGFAPHWPTAGPAFEEQFTPMGSWGIPAINTLLLLSSGVTVTLAHWALKENNRKQLVAFLALTVLLGVLFLVLQAYEYGHAI